jgi:hypothetical protein
MILRDALLYLLVNKLHSKDNKQFSVDSNKLFEPVNKVSKRGAGGDSHSRCPTSQKALWTHEESLALNSNSCAKLTEPSTTSIH